MDDEVPSTSGTQKRYRTTTTQTEQGTDEVLYEPLIIDSSPKVYNVIIDGVLGSDSGEIISQEIPANEDPVRRTNVSDEVGMWESRYIYVKFRKLN
jgi:hypothetical protein